MAERVLAAGFPLTVWARRSESLDPFQGTEAAVAASLSELGAHCELVCVCVFADGDVEEVVAGPEGLLSSMSPGSIIAIHSTVNPDTSRAMEAAARSVGVHVVDAPVSGAAPAARAGRLLVMVGGDAETVARARPVFEAFGDPVVHVGPVGSGQLVKLINNVVLTANFSILVDAVTLSEGFGIQPQLVLEVLRHGTGGSRAVDLLPESGSTAAVGARVHPLLGKDAAIAFAVARDLGASVGRLEEVIEHLWEVSGVETD
jgi:3-hydroxyisobutyrate dehydrogenase-like beta-hydroxyacid dehydrogenase